MNEFVALPGAPTRNSLIFTGLTFRTFSAMVSVCVLPFAVQEALPVRSPLKAAAPEVTLKVALMLLPAGTEPGNASALEATALQPSGTAMLSLTAVTGAPVA